MSEELKGVKLFVSIDNLVFERVLCKGKSKTPLLFEIVLRLHQLHIVWDLILHVIIIAGTQTI